MEPPPTISSILEAQAADQSGDASAEAPTPAPGKPVATAVPRCPVCGLEWSGYVQNNLLGCPDCWLSFLDQLDPLLERYHGTKLHAGRRPANAPSTTTINRKAATRRTRAARRAELQAALNEAVKAERYELAASLRDQLQTLDAHASNEATGDAGNPAVEER